LRISGLSNHLEFLIDASKPTRKNLVHSIAVEAAHRGQNPAKVVPMCNSCCDNDSAVVSLATWNSAAARRSEATVRRCLFFIASQKQILANFLDDFVGRHLHGESHGAT